MNKNSLLVHPSTLTNFLEFLRVADEFKCNQYSDLKTYNRLKELCPLCDEVKVKLKEYKAEKHTCISITDSPTSSEKQESKIRTNNDLLQDSGLSSGPYLEALENPVCSGDLEVVWTELNKANDIGKHAELFLKSVVLPKAKEEFLYPIQDILIDAYKTHPHLIMDLLLEELLRMGDNQEALQATLLQYVNSFPVSFKTDLTRRFVSSLESLHVFHITVLESLLSDQIETDIIEKIVNIMARNTANFCSNNAYGKLLFRLINASDKRLIQLERPLKHILAVHQSIWKIKLEFVLNKFFDDNLTQSFM